MFLLLIACYIPGIIGIASDGILPPPGDIEVLASGGAGRGYLPADLVVTTENDPVSSGKWTDPLWGLGLRGMVGLHPQLALRLDTQILAEKSNIGEGNLGLDLFYRGHDRFSFFAGGEVAHLPDTDMFIYSYGPHLGVIYGQSLAQNIRPYAGGSLSFLHYRGSGFIFTPSLSLGLSWRPSRWFVSAEGVTQWAFGQDNQWDMNGALLGGMLSIGFN